MIDVDVDAVSARRRTWVVGGILLVASSFFWLAAQASPLPGLGWASILLSAGGMLVFAFGLDPAGSVTARRPLGTTALAGLAAWNVASPLIPLFASPPVGSMADAETHAMSIQMITISTEVIGLVLATIAVTQIARAGVVPREWRWAPLWAFIVVAVAQTLPIALMTGAMTPGADAVHVFSGLLAIVIAGAECFLGVLAMVLAGRREVVNVYGS